ncbi:porin family protein [Elizabethkingia sp. JS20170427COW]|uniref:porin family protein n=1 Tax=Elizabethkingia sp. JS20170427COW TaxID=2583851 RepID=UPI001110223B|nr:porin family protein [Elizabethkingia sp. JS20170427COW]QCX53872.1 porin family protein [Elizabethkingia sp. JS20170427COW]
MKKIVAVCALAILGIGAKAQVSGGFKLGANIGIPVGDIKDVSSFTAGADLAYQWRLAENFDLGIASGYHHFFGKNNVKDFGMVPIAASGQYSVSPNVFIGADLGYAFITNVGGNTGGFYYQPKVGYQNSNWEVYAGYKGVSDDINFGSVNLGFNYKFK